MAGKLGRKPYTIFEIDFPRCTRTYGVAPCTASLANVEGRRHKCYNSRATCQALAAYLPETITHSYVMNIDGMPKKAGFFPMLQSVSTRAAEINLSGIDPKSTAMGVRARGTAVLADAQDNGSWSDPYAAQRRTGAAQQDGTGYKPEDRGTHWGKLLARQPYYAGLTCRVKRGYVGDDPATMPAEHYVISEVTGPGSGGSVQITYKDVFDLAESEKAVAPPVSVGKLLADLDAVATEVTLTPEGVGEDYPESGIVRIGRELIAYTRVGDVMTLTDRGAEGTEASSHKQLDVVQWCLVYDPARACDIGADLLQTYAKVPPAQIPLTEWQEENDNWMAGLGTSRTIISKPEGVKTLLGELCQIGVMFYPDVEAGVIRYKVNAPLGIGETYYDISEDLNIREGTVNIERGEDQRISALLLYHGVIDWTDSTDSVRNYSKVTVARIGDDPYEQDAIKEMTLRWYGRDGDDAGASVVTERLLARYENPPKIVSGELDVKDRDSVKLTSRLRVISRLLQDANGGGEPELMQANRVEYTGDDRVKFRAETYSLDGRFGFWMQNPLPDYSTATDYEKKNGAFWMDDTIGVFSDGTGPYVYF